MKVREIIKLIEEDGWALVRQRGSHRQYKHPTKSGLVTITSWFERTCAMKGYAVVIEGEEGSYSAYSPDLPGCVATGHTLDHVVFQMREAVRFHLEGLRLYGESAPPPSAVATTVIEAPAA